MVVISPSKKYSNQAERVAPFGHRENPWGIFLLPKNAISNSSDFRLSAAALRAKAFLKNRLIELLNKTQKLIRRERERENANSFVKFTKPRFTILLISKVHSAAISPVN